jgi:hypothetical protein
VRSRPRSTAEQALTAGRLDVRDGPIRRYYH